MRRVDEDANRTAFFHDFLAGARAVGLDAPGNKGRGDKATQLFLKPMGLDPLIVGSRPQPVGIRIHWVERQVEVNLSGMRQMFDEEALMEAVRGHDVWVRPSGKTIFIGRSIPAVDTNRPVAEQHESVTEIYECLKSLRNWWNESGRAVAQSSLG